MDRRFADERLSHKSVPFLSLSLSLSSFPSTTAVVLSFVVYLATVVGWRGVRIIYPRHGVFHSYRWMDRHGGVDYRLS